mgnify:CR=1 FL=1
MTKKSIYFAVALAILVTVAVASGIIPRQTPIAKASEIVELKDGDTYTLTMAPVKKMIDGKEYDILAYNGSTPGPTVRAAKGTRVTLILKNESAEETTLHAHGVRMANSFDGVPGVTQRAVAPGGEYRYELSFPDAGVFWYHPHVRTDEQLERGAYGAIVVTEGEIPANREETLVLDDILIENGALPPFGTDGPNYALMGRFGNVMLVNGETSWRTEARAGEVVRFYLVNAANARTFNLSIPGAKMKLVGADGGFYEREIFADGLLLSPGERATVDVLFDKAGSYTFTHTTLEKTYALGEIVVSGDAAAHSYAQEFERLGTNDIGLSDSVLAPARTRAPDKTLSIGVDMGGHMMHGGMMMGGVPTGGIEWEDEGMMNAMSTKGMVEWWMTDAATGKKNMDIEWTFPRGSYQKIRIVNDGSSTHPMQHPIHFHGQRFLVVERDGVRQTNLVWKDTVLVKAGETIDVLVEMSNPGTWMAHCHILEHAEGGMMLAFKVE